MNDYSYCLYYTTSSYWTSRPDSMGLRQAETPDECLEQVMREFQLPFVAYAVVSSSRNPNRWVWFTSCRCVEACFRSALRQEL